MAALPVPPGARSDRRESAVARFTRAQPQGAGVAAAADTLQDAHQEQTRGGGTPVESGAKRRGNALPHVRLHGEPETGAGGSGERRSREASRSETDTVGAK